MVRLWQWLVIWKSLKWSNRIILFNQPDSMQHIEMIFLTKLYLVLEFCSKGDLKKYLTSHKRAITKDCYSQLLHMASCCGHQDPSMLEEYLGLRNHGTINGSNEERSFERWVDNLFDIADYPPNMNGAGFGLLFSWCKQVSAVSCIIFWDSGYLCHSSTEMAEIWSPGTSFQDVWTYKISALYHGSRYIPSITCTFIEL